MLEGMANLFADRSSAWLSQQAHGVIQVTQTLRERGDLRALAAALGAFECDE
jgi:hypothetical protein